MDITIKHSTWKAKKNDGIVRSPSESYSHEQGIFLVHICDSSRIYLKYSIRLMFEH